MKILVTSLGGLLLAGAGTWLFYRQHPVECQLVYSIGHPKTEFYPDAYVVVHSQPELDRYFTMTSDTRLMRASLPAAATFDCQRYSYCIVYGRKVRRMHYSHKETWFDDKSPSYHSARRYGKQCLFVEYEPVTDSLNHIYRLAHDEELRGFSGP